MTGPGRSLRRTVSHCHLSGDAASGACEAVSSSPALHSDDGGVGYLRDVPTRLADWKPSWGHLFSLHSLLACLSTSRHTDATQGYSSGKDRVTAVELVCGCRLHKSEARSLENEVMGEEGGTADE